MAYKYFITICVVVLFMITNASVFSYAQSFDQDTLYHAHEQIRSVGYGNQPAWKVSGSLSVLDGSKLQKSFMANLANSLQGRLSGLTVTQNSAEPGLDSPGLYGRGIGTYGPGRDLLIMVDGFESSFEQLTPYEIESITLLKDASATSIYGSRGANGVLLVTTKRGQDGPLVVDFSARVGFQSANRMPQFLGSYDYARLYNEALENEGRPLIYTSDELDAYRTGNNTYLYPDVNYYDELLRSAAPVSNYNLNFRGGDGTVRYFGLLNMLDNKSLLINSGDLEPDNSINAHYTRYNFRTNVDVNLTNTLSAALTLGGSVEDKGNPASHTTQTIFDLMSSIPPNEFPVYNPDGSYGGSSLFSNPLGDILETGQYTSNSRTLQSTLRLTNRLDVITEGLRASAALSFNNYFRNYSEKSREYARFAIVGNGDDYQYNQIGQNTQLEGDESQSDQWRNFAFQISADYSRTFGHNGFDAMIVYNTENSTFDDSQHPFKYVGGGGRFTYTNRDRYIAEVSFGYNGTENFPAGNRFGFFPAASLGWIASNEGFLRENSVINYLKVRGSYGLTGNHNIADERFLFDQLYTSASSYHFGVDNNSNVSLYEDRPDNPDITWEKDIKFNIGFEVVLSSRLGLEVDFFRNNRYDILANPNQKMPGFFGMNLSGIWLNQGQVNNRGFEALLRYNSNPTNNLQYYVSLNAWYAQNEIVDMSEQVRLEDYQYRTGRAVGQPFGLEAIGFFKDEEDIANSPEQTFGPVQPGDIKYRDRNGDGVINDDDVGPIGNTGQPDFTAGLNVGLNYRSFDLDMMFHAVTGRTIYLSGNNFHAFQNDGKISEIALGRWTEETSESATYPRLSSDDNQNNYRFSSFWQRDGSFIKLRSIEVGYTLHGDFFNRIGLNNARVFVNGTNLFSLDHIDYTDPEIISGYPALRTFSAGFSFQL